MVWVIHFCFEDIYVIHLGDVNKQMAFDTSLLCACVAICDGEEYHIVFRWSL